MEIERKYLISHIPFDIAGYPFHQIEQAYLSTAPVVRVRQEDDTYYLTYKSKGLMAREEYNLPLTKESYEHLRSKADGRILTKKRYLIPMEGTIQRYIINDKTSNELDQNAPLLSGRTLYAGVSVRIFSAGAA